MKHDKLAQLPDSTEYVLSLIEPVGNQFRISIKWDGCVNLWTGDGDDKDMDYMHICDLDRFIAQLTEARDKAKLHFGEPWPG